VKGEEREEREEKASPKKIFNSVNNLSRIPRVNFINVLGATFTCADPESAKKYRQFVSLFCTFVICTRKKLLVEH